VPKESLPPEFTDEMEYLCSKDGVGDPKWKDVSNERPISGHFESKCWLSGPVGVWKKDRISALFKSIDEFEYESFEEAMEHLMLKTGSSTTGTTINCTECGPDNEFVDELRFPASLLQQGSRRSEHGEGSGGGSGSGSGLGSSSSGSGSSSSGGGGSGSGGGGSGSGGGGGGGSRPGSTDRNEFARCGDHKADICSNPKMSEAKDFCCVPKLQGVGDINYNFSRYVDSCGARMCTFRISGPMQFSEVFTQVGAWFGAVQSVVFVLFGTVFRLLNSGRVKKVKARVKGVLSGDDMEGGGKVGGKKQGGAWAETTPDQNLEAKVKALEEQIQALGRQINQAANQSQAQRPIEPPAVFAPAPSQFCSGCGAPKADATRFCTRCGSEFSDASPPLPGQAH